VHFSKKTTILFLVTFAAACVFGQADDKKNEIAYRFAFYNVENFFDAEVDPKSDYHEFDPDGTRHWSYSRYTDKRNKIYQVISAMGGWQPLTLIAFAEIENRFILQDLIESTALKNENYEIIHSDSEDERGIDVGLIYRKEAFNPLGVKSIPIVFEQDTSDKTRNILYVKGLLAEDTIHVFVNHWPSRYGGFLETSVLRQTAATTLKKVCDSVCQVQPNANILIMGDFNDDKENESLQLLTVSAHCELLALPLFSSDKRVHGTLKYQGKWNTFDQVVVSKNLVSGKGQLWLKEANGIIFSDSFLLEEDKTYSGMKPFRTYSGYKYNGGFSDHLPVYVDIYSNNSK
jgi:predicted extracellular nuclease